MAGKPAKAQTQALPNPGDEIAPTEAPAVADRVAAVTEHVAASQKRADAVRADRASERVDALLVERRGYVVRGLTDRVRQVDDQIRLWGGEPPEVD